MYDREEKIYKILSENLKGRDHLGYLGTEVNKIKKKREDADYIVSYIGETERVFMKGQ
jgi:hypothetical protein